MIRFGAGRRGSRLPLGSRSSRKSPLDNGVRPTRHREASSGCFAAAEAASSHLSVKGARSSGDFWLLRRRRAPAAHVRGGRVGGAQVRAGGSRAVRVVSRPKSASAAGSAAVCVVSRPKSGSAGPRRRRPRQIPSFAGFRSSMVGLRQRFPSPDGFRSPSSRRGRTAVRPRRRSPSFDDFRDASPANR